VAQEQFGISGFVVRLVVALILVFGTFNPSGYSFYHWALGIGRRRKTTLKVCSGHSAGNRINRLFAGDVAFDRPNWTRSRDCILWWDHLDCD
jgi:hypothetical protein